MQSIPTMFVGHGSPMVATDKSPASMFFSELGGMIPKPKSILCISAHWQEEKPTVSAATHPQTLYDFYGFPDELYSIRYHAPGSPELAASVSNCLFNAGIAYEVSSVRGLDHGAWVPLSLAYPDASIPVVQLSLSEKFSTEEHYNMGKAISKLRDEGVLIVGSGNATHNLYEYGEYEKDAAPPDWVRDFDSWLEDKIMARDVQALLDYRKSAPHAEDNHPTEEHIMPLFVAMGAAGDSFSVKKLHDSFSYGVISMASYSFS